MAMHGRAAWALCLSLVGSLVLAGCGEAPPPAPQKIAAKAQPPKPPAPPSAKPPAPPQAPPPGPKPLQPPAPPRMATGGSSSDYLAALNQYCSQGVTPDNNAAVLFLQAIGPGALYPDVRQHYCQMLGMPLPPEQGPHLLAYHQYSSQVRKPPAGGANANDANSAESTSEITAAIRAPWSPEAFPLIANWLQASEQPLALIVEASKRPRRFDPLISIDDPPLILNALMPMIQAHRDAARALVARAMLRLNAGNVADAWQDLLACHRLARLTGQGRTSIELLVAVSIDGLACAADQAVIAHGNLTADQLRQMHKDLQDLSPMPQLADVLDVGERYTFLDCVQTLAKGGLAQLGKITDVVGSLAESEPGSPAKDLSGLNMLPVDYDVVRQIGNAWYDRSVTAMRQPTWTQRFAALAQLEADHERLAEATKLSTFLSRALSGGSTRAVSESLGEILVALLLPAANAAAQAEARAAMTLELTKLGFLLAAYRAENGRYPQQLSDLVPQYIPQPPMDLFTGNPLVYQAQADGYLLYSVGANNRDDGGLGYEDRAATAGASHDVDDLAIRIPLTRD